MSRKPNRGRTPARPQQPQRKDVSSRPRLIIAHPRPGTQNELERLLAGADVTIESRLWSAGLPVDGDPIAAVLVPIDPAAREVTALEDEITTLGTELRNLIEAAGARGIPVRFVAMPALARDPALLPGLLTELIPGPSPSQGERQSSTPPSSPDVTARAATEAGRQPDALDVIALNREIERLRGELARAQAAPVAPAPPAGQVDDLNAQLADTRQRLETLNRDTQQHITHLERTLADKEAREAELVGDARTIAARLEDTRQLHEVSTRRESAAQMATQAMAIEIERLRSEHLRLVQLEAHYQDFRATNGRDMLAIQQRSALLEEQLQTAHRELAAAEERGGSLLGQLADARSEIAAARTQLGRTEDALQSLRDERADLGRQLASAEERGESALDRLAEAGSRLATVQADLEATGRALEEIRQERDALHEQLAHAGDRLAAVSPADQVDAAAHEALAAENDRLAGELTLARQAAERHAVEVAEGGRRLDALHGRLAAAQDRVAALNTASESRLLKLETAIEAQQRLDRLHRAAVAEVEVLKQTEESLREQIDTLSKRARTLERERDGVRDALAGMAAGRMASTLMLQRQTAALNRSRQELFAKRGDLVDRKN